VVKSKKPTVVGNKDEVRRHRREKQKKGSNGHGKKK
jgi:hypothetical protein